MPNRLAVFSSLQEKLPDAQMVIDVIRVLLGHAGADRDGFIQDARGAFEITLIRQSMVEALIGNRISIRERYRRAKFVGGFVEIPALSVKQAKVVVGEEAARVDVDRVGQHRDVISPEASLMEGQRC